MSNYQPGPDETVLLTVEARLDKDGMYVIKGPDGVTRVFLHSTNPVIVRVEPLPKPALPTAFGARIRATRLVGADSGTVTELVRVGDRWIGATDESRYEDDELSDVEVLHDPSAPHGVAEPEPLELPTGFGAVVSATYEGETAMAVRADPLSPASWFVSLPRSRTRWASDDELTRAVIIGPGVDVDLP